MLSLTIKIFATYQSTPCLAYVQIWGKLHWSVDSKVKKDIQSIWQALIKAKSQPSQNIIQSDERNKPKSDRKRNLVESESIPEEFLDALTCKRM